MFAGAVLRQEHAAVPPERTCPVAALCEPGCLFSAGRGGRSVVTSLSTHHALAFSRNAHGRHVGDERWQKGGHRGHGTAVRHGHRFDGARMVNQCTRGGYTGW